MVLRGPVAHAPGYQLPRGRRLVQGVPAAAWAVTGCEGVPAAARGGDRREGVPATAESGGWARGGTGCRRERRLGARAYRLPRRAAAGCEGVPAAAESGDRREGVPGGPHQTAAGECRGFIRQGAGGPFGGLPVPSRTFIPKGRRLRMWHHKAVPVGQRKCWRKVVDKGLERGAAAFLLRRRR